MQLLDLFREFKGYLNLLEIVFSSVEPFIVAKRQCRFPMPDQRQDLQADGDNAGG